MSEEKKKKEVQRTKAPCTVCGRIVTISIPTNYYPTTTIKGTLCLSPKCSEAISLNNRPKEVDSNDD